MRHEVGISMQVWLGTEQHCLALFLKHTWADGLVGGSAAAVP